MKRLLITIFISAEHNVQQGNSIKEYGTYKECEEALITINDIDEAIITEINQNLLKIRMDLLLL